MNLQLMACRRDHSEPLPVTTQLSDFFSKVSTEQPAIHIDTPHSAKLTSQLHWGSERLGVIELFMISLQNIITLCQNLLEQVHCVTVTVLGAFVTTWPCKSHSQFHAALPTSRPWLALLFAPQTAVKEGDSSIILTEHSHRSIVFTYSGFVMWTSICTHKQGHMDR